MAKRRANGEGNVRKRDDGRWEGRIVVGHRENGTPLFRYIHAKTQKELLDMLHRELELYRDVDLTEDSQMTLAAWLDRWLDEYMVNTVRPGTLAGYRMYANSYVKPLLGDKIVSQITAADVQKMYTKLKKEGRVHQTSEQGRALADATIRSIHTMFHHAMKAAEQERLTAKNPTEGAMIPKARHSPKRILTDGELDIFMLEKMSMAYNGVTLNKLIVQVRNMFSPGEDQDRFMAHVAMQGYEYHDAYDEYVYEISDFKRYKVSDGFPRLTVKDVNPAIRKASYEIALTELVPFEIS